MESPGDISGLFCVRDITAASSPFHFTPCKPPSTYFLDNSTIIVIIIGLNQINSIVTLIYGNFS